MNLIRRTREIDEEFFQSFSVENAADEDLVWHAWSDGERKHPLRRISQGGTLDRRNRLSGVEYPRRLLCILTRAEEIAGLGQRRERLKPYSEFIPRVAAPVWTGGPFR